MASAGGKNLSLEGLPTEEEARKKDINKPCCDKKAGGCNQSDAFLSDLICVERFGDEYRCSQIEEKCYNSMTPAMQGDVMKTAGNMIVEAQRMKIPLGKTPFTADSLVHELIPSMILFKKSCEANLRLFSSPDPDNGLLPLFSGKLNEEKQRAVVEKIDEIIKELRDYIEPLRKYEKIDLAKIPQTMFNLAFRPANRQNIMPPMYLHAFFTNLAKTYHRNSQSGGNKISKKRKTKRKKSKKRKSNKKRTRKSKKTRKSK